MTKKILLVGSQHGDELLGIRFYEYIVFKNPKLLSFVEYYCANPLAFSMNKRFIESDMNRSYANAQSTYEAERAKDLVRKIHSGEYKYVLDLHTTTTDVGVCFVTSQRNNTIDNIINASEIQNIVHMPHNIAKLSLISAADNVIAIEANNETSNNQGTLDDLAKILKQLLSDSKKPKMKRYTYYVERFITQNDKLASSKQLKNFKSEKGMYPVLYGGDTSKRTYQGFWATKKTVNLI